MQNLVFRVNLALVTLIGLLMFSSLSQCRKPGDIGVNESQILSAVEPANTPSLLHDSKAKSRGDLSIVVAVAQPHPKPPSLETRSIHLAKNQRSVMKIDLGEDLDNQEVSLNFQDHTVEYRVFQRYRTSISIANEGPHLDLVNRRHFDSRWFQLPSLSPRRFRTLRSEQMDSIRFPPTTHSEIVDEVRRQVGNNSEFVDVAKTCRGPNDGACWVGISSIYLRVQKRVRERWIDIALVEFRLPMGC